MTTTARTRRPTGDPPTCPCPACARFFFFFFSFHPRTHTTPHTPLCASFRLLLLLVFLRALVGRTRSTPASDPHGPFSAPPKPTPPPSLLRIARGARRRSVPRPSSPRRLAPARALAPKSAHLGPYTALRRMLCPVSFRQRSPFPTSPLSFSPSPLSTSLFCGSDRRHRAALHQLTLTPRGNDAPTCAVLDATPLLRRPPLASLGRTSLFPFCPFFSCGLRQTATPAPADATANTPFFCCCCSHLFFLCLYCFVTHLSLSRMACISRKIGMQAKRFLGAPFRSTANASTIAGASQFSSLGVPQGHHRGRSDRTRDFSQMMGPPTPEVAKLRRGGDLRGGGGGVARVCNHRAHRVIVSALSFWLIFP